MKNVFKGVWGVWFVAMVFSLVLSASMLQAQPQVNINEAPLELLQTIPGIGPVLAQRIVEYRKETPFKTIEEIKKVSGIGDATFEKMKDYITIK